MATYPIKIRRGDTFERWFTYKDSEGTIVPVSGYEIRAQIRESADSEDVLAEFDVDLSEADDGRFKISLSPEVTAALPATGGEWDLEWTDTLDRIVTPITRSKVTVLPDVTREVA